MGFVVKNTTIFKPLDLLCPHTCRGCGRLGAVLCECCKKNLLLQTQPVCPICKQIVAKPPKKVKNMTNGHFSTEESSENMQKILQSRSRIEKEPIQNTNEFLNNCENIQNIHENPTQVNTKPATVNLQEDTPQTDESETSPFCTGCETSFLELWSFGWREGVLEKLVEQYKYQSIRAMGDVLVELYDRILPDDLRDLVVVPLPTIGRHVRERGLDHTLTLAKKLARRRGWSCQQILSRAIDTVQVGAKMTDRKTQAAKAYMTNGNIDPSRHYLLLDDVWTTGATMFAAEKTLRAAGAEQISAVVLAVSKLKDQI